MISCNLVYPFCSRNNINIIERILHTDVHNKLNLSGCLSLWQRDFAWKECSQWFIKWLFALSTSRRCAVDNNMLKIPILHNITQAVRFIQRCQPVNDHFITNWNVIWQRRTVPLFTHGSASSDCKFKRWFIRKSFLNQMKNLLMATNEMIKTLDRCPFNIEQTLTTKSYLFTIKILFWGDSSILLLYFVLLLYF